MKKLLIGLMVCLSASSAFAAVGSFALPAETSILPGTSVEIPVSVNFTGATDAFVLFTEVTGPFKVTGLELISGTEWETNNQALYAELYGEKFGYASIAALVGNINIYPGVVLGKVTVTTDATAKIGDVGTISTESPDGGSELGLANMGIGQATGRLVVTPEPVSALLLLAGLPLIRRRRA